MTRQVFPTAEIPHKWAHQTQESARNPQGNLYFRGPTIYSYRDSWPLARIYRNKKSGVTSTGCVLVLTNSEKYSNTTAQHQYAVERAATHLAQIAVPYPAPRFEGSKLETAAHKENLAYFEKAMQRALEKAERATTEDKVRNYANRANALHKDMADYMMFFGIRRKMPALLSFAAAFERARRIENPDPASLDKRERDRAKRAAATDAVTEYRQEMARSMQAAGHWISSRAFRNAARWKTALENSMRRSKNGSDFYAHQALRSDWRLFGAFSGASDYSRVPGDVMLRIREDSPREGAEIETSLGARVPVAAAPMVWRIVEGVRNAKLGAARNLREGLAQRIMVGDYPLDRIDADGTLHAGCHTIPYSELASVARQLGLS